MRDVEQGERNGEKGIEADRSEEKERRRKLWEGERRRNEERRRREEERRREEKQGDRWRLGREVRGGEEEDEEERKRREEASRSNARMERRWNELTSSTRWNGGRQQKEEMGEKRQETHLGPAVGSYEAGSRRRRGEEGGGRGGEDDEDLPEDRHQLSTEMMGCSAEARVRRSLEKLNIPSWYTSHPPSPLPPSSLPTSPCPTLRWREGSLSSLPSSPTPGRWRDSPTSPPRWREASLPPPGPSRQTPVRSNMQLRNSERPAPAGAVPYLGWRSQEKLPSFLPTQTPSKVETVRQHL